MQLIKGESSFWINKNQLTKEKFEWQDEYFAFSVSESIIDKVRDYIKNQEEHHKRKLFRKNMMKSLQNLVSKNKIWLKPFTLSFTSSSWRIFKNIFKN
ncbi:type III secretory pathway component EscR [Flavobacterium piscis]|uniref:Type III secretory pathway component EscR n=2 Tax=Flavobacterium piscis TaxID=1114874 RepID=A0ABU1YAX9_9FLAO|nr:type III secretory pathway component EscR [Flavobacterium piscis]